MIYVYPRQHGHGYVYPSGQAQLPLQSEQFIPFPQQQLLQQLPIQPQQLQPMPITSAVMTDDPFTRFYGPPPTPAELNLSALGIPCSQWRWMPTEEKIRRLFNAWTLPSRYTGRDIPVDRRPGYGAIRAIVGSSTIQNVETGRDQYGNVYFQAPPYDWSQTIASMDSYCLDRSRFATATPVSQPYRTVYPAIAQTSVRYVRSDDPYAGRY